MQRSYDNAINYYDLATRIGKLNADYALYQQGLCYGAKGNVNQKIAVLNNMLETYPNTKYYDQTLFEIGNTYLVHGQYAASGQSRAAAHGVACLEEHRAEPHGCVLYDADGDP